MIRSAEPLPPFLDCMSRDTLAPIIPLPFFSFGSFFGEATQSDLDPIGCPVTHTKWQPSR